ncbi:hypothetical protein PSN45_004780 [Yamadazyma tenuis]|uniref:Protein kinase domain-containing protein n=2 Tax=Candida tenuis (strain ATCC 10573 / BCRC 21748 / CBS 615 / JCM 9827 / NBRC 10315 / NRRL Y-1498 / VKM Y-70) TaxID=590646 RepID=G3B1K8_CANTC|nr:uncharacterized protein CANTEDRAFT_92700 [Yamadazyma tenuis ATCC 10573]EGV64469.1 hypothetical protein CANTEDRAFT_92700 [Yamadazyma tenuis ATCC 10573]WEJ97231.1 hypothetical protein PSN45_004780 [Yamadazyma tenuis]
MEIPLKSQAKVSLTDIRKLDNSKYHIDNDDTLDTYDDEHQLNKLTRTYSETEVNNFDEETGHRLYDDELFRPKRTYMDQETESGISRLYSRSHGRPFGIEDEYIPGLNFSDMVYKWSDTPDLSRTNSTSSFLDLDDLHARVSPKKIFQGSLTSMSLKRMKTSQSDFDMILDSLPSNFNDMPYSQRKKVVKSINENVDYSQFSVYMKNYFGKKTLAGRLLSSTTDLKKIVPLNVDEKGARVMEYTLGKVIGFGAWGTIRECFDNNQNPYAMKIVSNKKMSVINLFKREIMIWEQLNHPKILKLFKYLETEDSIFCLMDRIKGGTLFELVSKWGVIEGNEDFSEDAQSLGGGPIRPVRSAQSISSFSIPSSRRVELVINFTRQIVKGVQYLHNSGIVHGDIKLENILVDKTKEAEDDWQMIICDFGMSRFYRSRSSTEIRSKSSMSEVRKPYKGESLHSRLLLNELNEKSRSRNNLSIKSMSRSNSPSKSEPTSSSSLESIKKYVREMKAKELKRQSQVDLDLPDSHIGSLPYASPELLLPNPPPLGPSADIWALGILIYTMIMGRLPFQHFYEPRLRAMIIKGKFNRKDLENVLKDHEWVNGLITGCLESDITKRLDIDLIDDMIERNTNTA